jgi:hypothetical protein
MTPAGEPSLGLLALKLQRRQAGRDEPHPYGGEEMTKKSEKWGDKPLTRQGWIIYSIQRLPERLRVSKMPKLERPVRINSGGVYPRLLKIKGQKSK